jgi:hypothetical protein
MLDPWIIEEIRRREEEERRDDRPQPSVIEMPDVDPGSPPSKKPEDETPRGIAIIDFRV